VRYAGLRDSHSKARHKKWMGVCRLSMKHRWSTRKSVAGSVILECPRNRLVRAAMRDVSLGGMFVEMSSVVLPLNAPVSVVFDLSTGDRRGSFCLEAMIVRHTGDGVG